MRGPVVMAGLCGAALVAWAPPAGAQTPDPDALEEQAYQDFAAGRLAAALRGYQRVYKLAPRPELLFAIGNLQQQLGQCDRATATLEAYLATRPATGAAKARALIAKCATASAASADPRPPAVSPPVIATRPVVRRDDGARRRRALVLGGVAILAAGGAIGFELTGQWHLDAYADTGRESEYDTANAWHYAAQGAAIAGAACLGGAVYLWLSGRPRADAAVGVAPQAGGALVTWRGGF